MNEKLSHLFGETLRAHGYFADDTLTVEEQRSDNPRIKKLLKLASKVGSGQGNPEFIVSSSKYPDFLVVVECKADPSKHESPTRDKYAECAVDGALLYASYLSKEYDVLAIGVSGETKQNLKISHFLCLKGTGSREPIFAGKLLPFDDYYSGYINDPRKFSQDYEKLLAYSRELNE